MNTALRRLAAALALLTVVLGVVQPVVLASGGLSLWSAEAIDHAFPLVSLGATTGAVVGAVIIARHPRHRIGWVFVVGYSGFAAAQVAEAYGWAVLDGTLPGPADLAHLASWLATSSSVFLVTSMALLALLAPNGELPAGGWRLVRYLLAGSVALFVVGLLLVPPAMMEPGGPSDPGLVPTVLVVGSQIGSAVGLVAAGVALILRLRRASGEHRQQLRWFAVALATAALALAAIIVHNLARGGNVAADGLLLLLFSLGILGVPIAIGFAVLRYRLYDIDLVIGTAVKAAVLSGFVTAGYVAVVAGAGAVLGRAGPPSYAISVLALVVVAVAFQPIRRRLNAITDRIVYGRRADPYEALAAFGRSLARRLPDAAVLPRVAEVAASATGAGQVEVRLDLPGRGAQVAVWPEQPSAELTDHLEIPVVHGGEHLGELEVRMPRGWSLNSEQLRLTRQLAGQAGLAFHNVRIAAALEARAEDLASDTDALAASQRRLVSAVDAERDRLVQALRRDVHPHLQVIAQQVDRVPELVHAGDHEAADRLLADVETEVAQALDALRDLSHGIFPGRLATHGLLPALETYANRHNIGLHAGASMRAGRLPPSVEATGYFCAVELLTTLDGGTVDLDVVEDTARIAVDGSPAAPLSSELRQRLTDRVEATGGTITFAETPGSGLHVAVRLPLEPTEAGSARYRDASDAPSSGKA